MKLGALINLPVIDASGHKLGQLQEIHAVNGRVTELVCGPGGLFERLTGRSEPSVIRWARVDRVTASGIRLK